MYYLLGRHQPCRVLPKMVGVLSVVTHDLYSKKLRLAHGTCQATAVDSSLAYALQVMHVNAQLVWDFD